MSTSTLSRRTVLTGALAGGAALMLGSSLAGCTPQGGTAAEEGATAGGAKGILPDYIPFAGAVADFPATENGADAAFRRYPKDRVKSVAAVPGSGGSLTGMANIFLAVPPAAAANSYWAGLNKRLGVSLDLQMVPSADYQQKFATTIAGGDLPDVMQIQATAGLPQLLDKRFQPLEDYLAGDAVEEYPNLANLRTSQWEQAVVNDSLYGIPIPRSQVLFYSFIRKDLFDAAKVSTEPKGLDELLETGKALTSEKARRWAFGSIDHVRIYLQMMNKTPNGWKESGGKLTHAYESAQFEQVVEDLITIWKAGIVHPDSFSTTFQPKALFAAGGVAINAVDGLSGWAQYINDGSTNPDFELGVMPIYTRDGSELAPWHVGSGVYSFTALKKQDDPEKVKEVLRVLDWLAAPFGTEEYTYRVFGKEGDDHTTDASGNLSLTAQGATNTAVPTRYLAEGPYTIFQPGRPDDADLQHAYQEKIMAQTKMNPTYGLLSETALAKNSTIDKAFIDGVKDIIQGRQPAASLQGLVSTWRSGGGDAMRHEYEGQLQARG